MPSEEHEMDHINFWTDEAANPWDDAEEWEQDAQPGARNDLIRPYARQSEKKRPMGTERTQIVFTTRASSREVVQLVRRIQGLTLEVRTLEQDGTNGAELIAKERALEQLRWRLAIAARRAAHHDFGAATYPAQ
jgi:hypothetical protein